MALVIAGAICLTAVIGTLPPRPPQFVVVSFDGSGDAEDLRFWLDAADRVDARFTFFLSGVYLLAGDQSFRYRPPQHVAGSSDIGFAIKPDDADVRTGLRDLVLSLNDAAARGHEIGSHFNGHFCGRRAGAVQQWSAADWDQELDQFDALVSGVRGNNELDVDLQMPAISGTRTPCLEGNLSLLHAVAAKRGLRYDASLPGYAGRWPWRDGVWLFPIPTIPVADEIFSTLASDYNFYLNQTGASEADPDDTEALADQMYRSLRAYFDDQHSRERAPVSIAYHFEDWNHGAYREALVRFLSDVCKRWDVRCTTYRDVVTWMER